MPPKPRDPAVIDEIKLNILYQALDLIMEEGFEGFSMRKLAKRLGVTAVTIYNYYVNKDDLYLAILTHGFDQLYKECLAAYESKDNPLDRVAEMMSVFVDFGFRETNMYSLMFTWHVPKHNDYVGTDMEQAANNELRTALMVNALFMQAAMELVRPTTNQSEPHEGNGISVEMLRVYVISVWCTLHGYISACANTLLSYVYETPTSLKQSIISILMDTILRLTQTTEQAGKDPITAVPDTSKTIVSSSIKK
jgi:AcrR family transcriptional regulator